LKYGLAVTGLIDPARIVRNSTACPGDRLILTKPLGTGIIATAVKADMVPPVAAKETVRWMTALNATAAELMVACNAHAATDVTGFGLIGHATEMARGADVTFQIQVERVPLMTGVADLVRDGLVPAGCYRNRDFFAGSAGGDRELADELLPLFDPQTSGGLLIALAPSAAELFCALAAEKGCFAACIGEVLSRREHLVALS
jgi:selenide,water dikinase